MNKNSLLKICDLTSEEIFHILEDAAAFSSSQSDWQFPRKTLVADVYKRQPVSDEVYSALEQ